MKNRDSLNSKPVRPDYFGMDGTLIYYIVVYCSAVGEGGAGFRPGREMDRHSKGW